MAAICKQGRWLSATGKRGQRLHLSLGLIRRGLSRPQLPYVWVAWRQAWWFSLGKRACEHQAGDWSPGPSTLPLLIGRGSGAGTVECVLLFFLYVPLLLWRFPLPHSSHSPGVCIKLNKNIKIYKWKILALISPFSYPQNRFDNSCNPGWGPWSSASSSRLRSHFHAAPAPV